MRSDLAGGTVWITGAGSGIGAAMARAFAAEGCVVALTGRRADALEEAADAVRGAGGEALTRPCDVLDREGMAAIGAELAETTGRLEVLCNNAGLNIPRRSWADIDWESWDAVLDINIKGALNAIAAVLPTMRARGGGVIVSTSSWARRFHSPVSGVAYGASKFALSDISASLNSEEGVNGIRACALQPAEVATPLLLGRPGFDASKIDAMIQPEDLADAAVFAARMNPNVAVHEITVAPVRR